LAGGEPVTDYDCQNALTNSTNTISIDSLNDATSYNFAYQVRSYDDRPYAETTTPATLAVTTQAISTGNSTNTEEESQYIIIFGLLSFILLLIINAWSIDSWKH